MSKRLSGKVALITGASMGIGEAIARVFADEGARLALAARSLDKLEAVARSMPTEAIAIQSDMTKPDQVRAMVAKVVEHFGRLDILVNNAAVGMYASIADMKPAEFEQVVATNWLGPVHAIQAAIPHMRKQGGGDIINISSVAGRLAIPWMGTYCSTKFALGALSTSLRMELKPDHIHVLLVCPGRVKTPFTQNAYKDFATKALYPGGITAEKVARVTLRAMLWRRREVVVPASNRVFGWFRNSLPGLADRVMVQVLGRQMRQELNSKGAGWKGCAWLVRRALLRL